MTVAYIIISSILALVWLLVLFVPPFMIISESTNKEDRKFELQVWSAAVAAGFIFVFAWPVVFILAIPLLLVYGLFQAVMLLITKPWKTE